MNRSEFKTNYIIYEVRCIDDGLYYIGAHHCRGVRLCTKHACRYRGSSSKVRELMLSDPSRSWDVTVLEFARDREEMVELEMLYLELHIGETKCLNVRVTPYPVWNCTGHKKRWVEMFSPKGVKMRVRTTSYLSAVQLGFSKVAIRPTLWLSNEAFGIAVYVSEAVIRSNIAAILNSGWDWGGNQDFIKVSVSTFLCTLHGAESHQGVTGLTLRAY